MKRLFLAMLFFPLVFAQEISVENTIQNLEAFARLYGYIRWFHPSDEASQVPWDDFAIYGSHRVKSAKNSEELKNILKELFYPIAPTLQIYQTGEAMIDFKKTLPENATGLKIVAWQHRGLGFSNAESIYTSIRINRKNWLSNVYAFGNILQGIDAVSLRGKNIRYRASVKTKVFGAGNQGQLWLRVDCSDQTMGFFDNMQNRPIVSDQWQSYEISGKVNDNAQQIVFGCFLMGAGELGFDQVELSIQEGDQWVPVSVKNAGFEEGKLGAYPPQWNATGKGHLHKITDQQCSEGKQSLFIESKQDVFTGELFKEYPKMGELCTQEILPGLWCQFPLALYSDEQKTLGSNPEYPVEKLQQSMKHFKPAYFSATDENVRLGNIIISWNIMQHFYPYFDVLSLDWLDILRKTLLRTFQDKTEKDFYFTLSQFIAKLQDGHAMVYHSFLRSEAILPIKVCWIENQLVITVSRNSAKFKPGDVLVSIDQKDAKTVLFDLEEYVSGSKQWKREIALMSLFRGPEGTPCKVQIQREGKILEVEEFRYFRGDLRENPRESIEKLDPDIYYVNLDQATMKEISAVLPDLAKAKGIVFDLRGYPNGNHQILSYLLKEADTSQQWMQIPLLIYPDQKNRVGYAFSGWSLPSLTPQIQGKVVFLTNGKAISYAESFLSFVEQYHLGEIVGSTTAGANGNVNSLNLPGGFSISWTGMRVVKQDGTQHHLIGISPTVPVERTIEGVKNQRDEYLEKALELINHP
ncbi:MAG: S41 family peptidase [Planctomycetota bacterium]